MAKGIKVVLLKNGRALKANGEGKARVFKSIKNADAFARNLVRVSNDLKMVNFETIAIG